MAIKIVIVEFFIDILEHGDPLDDVHSLVAIGIIVGSIDLDEKKYIKLVKIIYEIVKYYYMLGNDKVSPPPFILLIIIQYISAKFYIFFAADDALQEKIS